MSLYAFAGVVRGAMNRQSLSNAYLCYDCHTTLEAQGLILHRLPLTDDQCDQCGGKKQSVLYEWRERPAHRRRPGPSEVKEYGHG